MCAWMCMHFCVNEGFLPQSKHGGQRATSGQRAATGVSPHLSLITQNVKF